MLVFIIPVYNESENIPILLSKIKKLMDDKSFRYKIIAINDGSTDNSLFILKEHSQHIPMEICNHTTNLGPGKAFLTGFTTALEIASDDDVIVTLEADNTSDLAILPELISKLNNGNDVVLASCYASGGKVLNTLFYRRFISWAANLLIKNLFSIKQIHTFSSFYRVYQTKALKATFNYFGDSTIEQKGFSCMTELLLKFKVLGLKIAEVPMCLKSDIRQGKSKMKIFKTTIEYFCLFLKFLVNRRKYIKKTL